MVDGEGRDAALAGYDLRGELCRKAVRTYGRGWVYIVCTAFAPQQPELPVFAALPEEAIGVIELREHPVGGIVHLDPHISRASNGGLANRLRFQRSWRFIERFTSKMNVALLFFLREYQNPRGTCSGLR